MDRLYRGQARNIQIIRPGQEKIGLRENFTSEIMDSKGRAIVIVQEAEGISRHETSQALIEAIKTVFETNPEAVIEVIIGKGPNFEKFTFTKETIKNIEKGAEIKGEPLKDASEAGDFLKERAEKDDPQRIMLFDPHEVVGFDAKIHSSRDPLFMFVFDSNTTSEFAQQSLRRSRASISSTKEDGGLPHDQKMLVLDLDGKIQERMTASKKSKLKVIRDTFINNQDKVEKEGLAFVLKDSFNESYNKAFDEMRFLAENHEEINAINEAQSLFQSEVKHAWRERSKEGYAGKSLLNEEIRILKRKFEDTMSKKRSSLPLNSRKIGDIYIAKNRGLGRNKDGDLKLEPKGKGIPDDSTVRLGSRDLKDQVDFVNTAFGESDLEAIVSTSGFSKDGVSDGARVAQARNFFTKQLGLTGRKTPSDSKLTPALKEGSSGVIRGPIKWLDAVSSGVNKVPANNPIKSHIVTAVNALRKISGDDEWKNADDFERLRFIATVAIAAVFNEKMPAALGGSHSVSYVQTKISNLKEDEKARLNVVIGALTAGSMDTNSLATIITNYGTLESLSQTLAQETDLNTMQGILRNRDGLKTYIDLNNRFSYRRLMYSVMKNSPFRKHNYAYEDMSRIGLLSEGGYRINSKEHAKLFGALGLDASNIIGDFRDNLVSHGISLGASS
ncbi:MAG: hypothetical protein ABH914_01880, partial [Candidatus Omnitrophota bacterium]